jgi:diguanylate cyclase (GGDEF)-like protein/PAS domain S-box-containing protein
MMAKFSAWHSLKARATVFTLAVFVLGICSLSLYISRTLQTDMERLLGEQQLSVASAVAQEIDDHLVNRRQALETIADELTPALIGDPAALQKHMEQRPLLPTLFNLGVFVTDLDGTVIADLPRSAQRVGLNYMDRDFIAATLKEAKSVISQPVMGKTSKAPVFGMTAPVRGAKGQVIGAIVGATNLGEPNFLDKLLRSPYGQTGGYALVAPQSRQIITATDKNRIMEVLPAPGVHQYVDRNIAGYEGYSVLVNALGEKQLASVKRIPAAGWYLLLGTPTTEAFGPLYALQQRVIWLTLLLILLTGALTWWVLGRQFAPLVTTADAMAALADSTHSQQPLPTTQLGEVGMLVAGFNRILQTWTQRQTELQASEQQYRSLVENLSSGVLVHRPDTSISLSNPRASELLGLTQDQMLGKTATDPDWRFIRDDETPLPLEDYPVSRVLSSDRPLENFVLGVCRPGREDPTWLIGNAFPMRDAQGKIFQVVVTFTDITQRKHAELALSASEARWKFAIEGAGDGLWDWNIQSGVAFYSLRYKEMLGYADADIGTTSDEWSKRIHPEDAPAVFSAMKPYMDGKPGNATVEFRMLRKDGSWQWILGRGMVVERDAQGKPLRMIGTNTDLTERKRVADELAHKTAFFEAIFKSIPDAIVTTNVKREVVAINPAFTAILGYHLDELAGRQTAHFYESQDDYDRQGRLRFNLTAHERSLPYQVNYKKRDGTVFPGETLGTSIEDADGIVLGYLGVIRDVTERLQGQARLQLAANVFEHAREAITVTDAKGSIVDINHAFTRITGYEREEVIGQNPRILKSGRQDPAFYAAMWGALAAQGHWSGEIWNRRKNGDIYPELLTISAVRDGQGHTQQYVALFSDISAIKAHQSQLEHIAHFDALTNLPNRVLLADRLQQAMVQVKRRGQQLAVVYLDLDGFKAINDRHGHDVGDQLLITLSDAMKNALREGDTLARMGGDEFVAVLIDLVNPASCVPMLTRLLEAAATPVAMGELLLQGSASLGVTFYPQEQDIDADQLLRQADQAMYQAKVAGKHRYHIFDAKQDSSNRAHNESLERIGLALEQGEFVLHYQPKVNMRSGKIIGAEALIRWQHPEKGLLAPAAFLPAIENHPLAVAVGEWVIDTALSQVERWHGFGLDLPVSVNIGAFQLQRSDFVERLQSVLSTHPQVSPSSLELEVLETSALADMAQVSQVIEDCARIGVMFALDDFGTGYSSLTYLKRLRVKVLKIDQSFVRDMLNDPDDMAILEGIIGLAVAFRRQVIAEGVETVAHGTALLHLGCELAQGYGIARPMPAEQLPAWAATWEPDVAWLELPWRGGQWQPGTAI